MGALRALVFDLDDTLYAEVDYVRSGFHAVAERLGAASGLVPRVLYSFLESAQASELRGKVFDALLEAHPVCQQLFTPPELVAVYRDHTPRLELYPGIAELLDEAKGAGLRIAIITDGYRNAQEQKIKALGLSRWANPILVTDAWGRSYWKPHARAFLEVEGALAMQGSELIYIGDNPQKDFITPNARSWRSCHLRLEKQIYYPFGLGSGNQAAQHSVHSITELRDYLMGLAEASGRA